MTGNGGSRACVRREGFPTLSAEGKIDDEALCEAIERAERGVIDADLGGGLIKQRVARHGQGRSGGYRTIIAYREGDRAFFEKEKKALTSVGRALLGLSAMQIEEHVEDNVIKEIDDDA